jgi:hypothetical protein
MSDYIAEIQSVLLKLHGCDVTYVETVPIVEAFQGQTSGKVTLKYSSLQLESDTRIRLGICNN